MILWEIFCLDSISNLCFNSNFEKENYRGEKVLESPETCKSTKIFLGIVEKT
jgi:hypothetical protein